MITDWNYYTEDTQLNQACMALSMLAKVGGGCREEPFHNQKS